MGRKVWLRWGFGHSVELCIRFVMTIRCGSMGVCVISGERTQHGI